MIMILLSVMNEGEGGRPFKFTDRYRVPRGYTLPVLYAL
jgi:hypothetical protein